uniref:DLA class II histocompatibility antigen, DR-1 beta chain-like n=1 Tax=Panthera onca TaxID=9690 RepID=UPI00295494E2|nr:DLA class II histocompatibility antigen, DR-1 beta chain-like [Panthera onca]
MVCLCFLGGSWLIALMLILMVLSPPLAWARDTSSHFLVMGKSECHFTNGTERVRFLARYFYNREELARFDNEVGEYRAVSELGRPGAKYWKGQKDVLEQKRTAVDRFCRHNYGVGESFSGEVRGAGGLGWPGLRLCDCETETGSQ